MLDSWVEEFLMVAKYMNISRAARELHMTQPNLSRHIKQMEAEIGFRLFTHHGGSLALTPAGVEYAENLTSIMSSFRELTKRCATMPDNISRTLNVQKAPYPNEAGKLYLRFLDNTINKEWRYEFNFVSESQSRKTFKPSVLDQEVDIAVIYMFEKPDEAIPQLAEEGFSAFFLADVPLGVWLPVGHELAHETEISVEQLSRITILFPNNPNHPLKEGYAKLFSEHNLIPNYKEVHVSSRLSFVFHQSPEFGYLFPYDMKDDFALVWQDSRVMVPLDTNITFSVYIITAQSSNLF
jgi:DNA-binding transcriptional LysR family regulator